MTCSTNEPASKSVILVHHTASRGSHHPPNSLQGLQECLKARARVVEMDIIPLVGGDFALLHDLRLEAHTDGKGYVYTTPADQVQRMHYVSQNAVTDEPVGLLSQAIELIRNDTDLHELQLDLKPYSPPDSSILENLLQIIEPVKDRVRVTSVADWTLRQLRTLDPDLSLGFDPLLYLDVETSESRSNGIPPFRVGPYGYRDDHPLSAFRWGASADYLAARTEALHAQVTAKAFWYVRASLIDRALADGFDWIGFLHVQGTEIVAWTLDADNTDQLELAQRLVDGKIDRITTNDAPRLARALPGLVVF